jgi:hypothetical protein
MPATDFPLAAENHLSPDSFRAGRMPGQQRALAPHTGSEKLLNQLGDLFCELKCRSSEDYAVLLTPQNRGSGACTMPLTVLRQA